MRPHSWGTQVSAEQAAEQAGSNRGEGAAAAGDAGGDTGGTAEQPAAAGGEAVHTAEGQAPAGRTTRRASAQRDSLEQAKTVKQEPTAKAERPEAPAPVQVERTEESVWAEVPVPPAAAAALRTELCSRSQPLFRTHPALGQGSPRA